MIIHRNRRHRSVRTTGLLVVATLLVASCAQDTPTVGQAVKATASTMEASAASSAAPTSTSTAVTTTTMTPGPATVTVGPQDEADLDYLPDEEVASHVAAYQAAAKASYLSIDGVDEPLISASFLGTVEIHSKSATLELILDGDQIERALLSYSGSQWQMGQPTNIEEDGDVVELLLSMVDIDDPSAMVEVRLRLDVNMAGGGTSVVTVRDHYALISGTLGTSTYVQFQDLIANNPQVDTLVMTHVDGSENDQINVHSARLIREAGWTTWVAANGDIASGGVDMFAAGVERYAESGAFLGVHSWAGDDGTVGSEFPRDHPAHRSMLEYFSEMLGDKPGSDFYFYTLEAASPERIHRMSPAEIDLYGLTTGMPAASLPASVVGEHQAGYIEALDGVYLKLSVLSCSVEDGSGEVQLVSPDIGGTTITATGGNGTLLFDELPPSLSSHVVTELMVADGTLTATIDLELGDGLGGDTSNAALTIPCVG